MKKLNGRQLAIMDWDSASIELHTLPQSVKSKKDFENYLYLTLELNSNQEWMLADKILISDYRHKKSLK